VEISRIRKGDPILSLCENTSLRLVTGLPAWSPVAEVRIPRATDDGVVKRYRLKTPIRAILNKPDGKLISVDIPAGVILIRGLRPAI